MEAIFPPDKSPYHWVAMPITPQSAAFLATNTVLQAITLCIVGLRFYSRITTRSFGWDDWWVVIATVCIGRNGTEQADCLNLAYKS
jgi:hypothetical protein